METNNAILFTFGLIFLLLGIFAPIINSEYGNEYNTNDVGKFSDVAQEDISSTTAVQVLGGIFFWVFGAPFWINAILTMMRVIFWIIVYDKIRGI